MSNNAVMIFHKFDLPCIFGTSIQNKLRHKPEGRGFDSRWCHWNFSLTQYFRLRYGRGVDSASNRNEYQEYFLGGKGGRCVGLKTLPPSCADCLEIWEPDSWNTQGLPRPVMGFLDLYILVLKTTRYNSVAAGMTQSAW
jgi:hypothetical protein